jgi:hypothetical protein
MDLGLARKGLPPAAKPVIQPHRGPSRPNRQNGWFFTLRSARSDWQHGGSAADVRSTKIVQEAPLGPRTPATTFSTARYLCSVTLSSHNMSRSVNHQAESMCKASSGTAARTWLSRSGAEGVIVAEADHLGGFSLWVQDGKLTTPTR